jgi:S1-C subfamily serine protease
MKIYFGIKNSFDEDDDEIPIQLLSGIGIRVGIKEHEAENESTFQTNERLYVECIDYGKAAALSGIRKDDVIEEINGFEICSWTDVEKALYSQTTEKPIRLVVRRRDSVRSLTYMAAWQD